MKVAFDVSLVVVSVVLGLAFLGGVEGVREGTVAAALLVGTIARWLCGVCYRHIPGLGAR